MQEWIETVKDDAVRKAKEEEDARILAQTQQFTALGELLVRSSFLLSVFQRYDLGITLPCV